MDGYKDLVMEAVDLSIIAIPIIKGIVGAFLPEDLKKALDHLYLGLIGANAWVGYATAAGYYMALDQGYGVEFCEGSGVLFSIVSFMHMFIDWNKKNERYIKQAEVEKEAREA